MQCNFLFVVSHQCGWHSVGRAGMRSFSVVATSQRPCGGHARRLVLESPVPPSVVRGDVRSRALPRCAHVEGLRFPPHPPAGHSLQDWAPGGRGLLPPCVTAAHPHPASACKARSSQTHARALTCLGFAASWGFLRGFREQEAPPPTAPPPPFLFSFCDLGESS